MSKVNSRAQPDCESFGRLTLCVKYFKLPSGNYIKTLYTLAFVKYEAMRE